MSNLTRTADYLANSLEALGFVIMSKKSGEGLPLVAFRLKELETTNEEGEKLERNYDEFALAHKLRARGWVVPAYTMAPHTNDLKMLRVVVREDFTKNRCDALISDIRLCQQLLDQLDTESVRKQEEFIRKHTMNSGQAKHNHPRFRVRIRPTHLLFFSFPPFKFCTLILYILSPQRNNANLFEQKEKHSIQGKHGKTHSIC